MRMPQIRFRHSLSAVIALLLVFGAGSPCAAGPSEPPDMDQVTTFDEMATVLSTLATRLSTEIKSDTPSYEVQKEILSRAGEGISRLASLCQQNRYDPAAVRQSGKALFSTNREIILKILTTNEETIRYFQEEVLDTMENPMAFFQTAKWQHPRQLVSLSSYWLGWNGYYASLVLPEEDPVRRQMLMEGIDGFSRAFIDFEEEAVIAKSLYGRGLCYKQLNAYQSALYDFKAVKDRISGDDLLLARCLLEEALISYDTGNLKVTVEKLDRIEELFHEEGVPDPMAASVAELRVNVLLYRLEKENDRRDDDGFDDSWLTTFREMKQLAVNRGRINDSFYRYVQSHAADLEKLSYGELGPVAAMAIGDGYYADESYDRALFYYRKVLADTAPDFSQEMDRLTYRTAYIHYNARQWEEVVRLMKGFHDTFPRTLLEKQASSLYYAAAAHRYKEIGDGDTYSTYIDAIQSYLACCDGCTGRSEARFQLGRYYLKNGETQLADAEFSAVEEDSPHFFQARYYILESCVQQLDKLSEQRPADAGEKRALYHEGVGTIREYRQVTPGEEGAENREALAPFMALLQARLYLHGETDAWETGYLLLGAFEENYPTETERFLDAAKLRIEYCVLLGKEDAFETELSALVDPRPVPPPQYAGLHDLANRFYATSKESSSEIAPGMSSRYALSALSIYEKLYAVSAEDPSYRTYSDPIELRMARICMKENDVDRAAALYGNILRKNPGSADAVYGLGLIYEQRGQWQEALQTWRKFSDGVEAGTYHWFQSRYRTAIALHNLGETDKACTVITMTRVLHPDVGDDELAAKFLELETTLCKEGTKK